MTIYSATILADSPAAYYRLGDLSGTSAADSSGNSNTGTYNGGFSLGLVGAIAGENNAAVGFDGLTYVDNSVAVSGSFSLEAWIYPTSVGAVEAPIIGSGFVLDNTGALCIGTGGASTGYFPTFSTWTHVALVSDGVNLFGYANGVLRRQFTATFAYTAGQARIGGRPDIGPNSDWSFHGSIDEVAIYPAVLSAARILAHYNAGIAQGFLGCGVGKSPFIRGGR
jgi:hypothetical protein